MLYKLLINNVKQSFKMFNVDDYVLLNAAFAF